MNEIKEYRRRPQIVNAIKFSGYNAKDIEQFISHKVEHFGNQFIIELKDSQIEFSKGDYIVKDETGKCGVMQPDAFNEMYEEIIT